MKFYLHIPKWIASPIRNFLNFSFFSGRRCKLCIQTISSDKKIYVKANCTLLSAKMSTQDGGGRVVRRCWVNFQCRGVLLTWITVGQGPIVLAVGAGGGCLDIFSLIYHFSFLSPSLWETARYRLKYCLKGPLSPNQSVSQSTQDIKS